MPRLALLLSTLIWGATFPATKAALDQLQPFTFLCLRFFIGLLVTISIFAGLRWRLQRGAGMLRISAIATVFLFIGYATQTVGLRYTTASNSAFITALYVVFVPLFLRRFERRTWLSAGLATLGLWLLVNPSVSMNIGDVLSLVCAVAFGAHIACLESYTKRGDSRSFFFWQVLMLAGLMVPAMALEIPGRLDLSLSLVLIVSLTVTGVLATGAFAVQVWAQQRLPAQQVALVFSMEPAYAAWLAWYFLGEQLDSRAWLGSGLIFLAVLVGALAATKQTASAAPLPA
jgi:drug/metabolite transporter (DMT)-like permease